jgi:hypothetical protein
LSGCLRSTGTGICTPAQSALWIVVSGRAARLLAGFRHRWTMQRITRFSDHRLQDMGFERDRDGSLVPTRR